MKRGIATIVNSETINNEMNSGDINNEIDVNAAADAGTNIDFDANNIEKSSLSTITMPSKQQQQQTTDNNQCHQQQSAKQMAMIEKRNLWRPDEVLCMLFAMQNIQALDQLNNKNVKSERVFKDVEKIMFSNGFRKKSHNQIWTKWKFLKSTYNTSQRNGIIPRIVSPEIYKELDKMLRFKHVDTNGSIDMDSTNNFSDCGNSDMCSIDDGDNSMNFSATANTSVKVTTLSSSASTMTATTTTTNNITISDVSGGLNSSNDIVINGVNHINNSLQKNSGINNFKMTHEQIDNNLNMAHPIFGFRLGLIKPEPIDTGYEAIEQNGIERHALSIDNSNGVTLVSNANAYVKQEIENEANVSTNRQSLAMINEDLINTCQEHSKSFDVAKLPPLRVAPFAQIASTKTADETKIPSRPPPPLTIPPTLRPTSLVSRGNNNYYYNNNGNNSNSNNNSNYNAFRNNNVTRIAKLNENHTKPSSTTSSLLNLGPKISMGPNVPPIRLSKEITIQQTNRNAAFISNFPKVKQVPMRKTPYSLRPDRVIPDLDSSDSPPASETSSGHHMEDDLSITPEYHSISSSTAPTKTFMKRKRRLDWQESYTNLTVATTRTTGAVITTTSAGPSSKIQKTTNNLCNNEMTSPPDDRKDKRSKSYENLITNVIRDVTTTLRDMQSEMMQGFLKTQQDLIRQEHAFQMQQDEMLMKAFQNQTQHIMNTLTELMVTDNTKQQNGSCNSVNQQPEIHYAHEQQQQPPPQIATRPRGRPRKYHHNHNHNLKMQKQQQKKKQLQHIAHRTKYVTNKMEIEENIATPSANLYSDDTNEEDLKGYKEADEDLNSDDEQQEQLLKHDINNTSNKHNNSNEIKKAQEVKEAEEEHQEQASTKVNNNAVVNVRHKKKYERYNNGNHNLNHLKDDEK